MATVLLLHGDGTNGSTAIVDETGKPVTANGNAQISTAQSRFGSSSIAFDGNADYLGIADTTELTMGSSDFTIEGYVRFSSVTTLQCIYEKRASFHARGLAIFLDTDSKLYFNAGDSTTTAWEVSISSAVLSTNTWYHFAFTRSGSSWRAFIDGTQLGSTVTSSFTVDDGSAALRIGYFQNSTGSLNGYLDELRINKGEALYTSAFVVPTQPFFHQNTVLLLRCDGTNGSTTFRDETGKSLTGTGAAQISTAQSKFGGSSYVGNGASNYLTIASHSSELAFGTGDFTIEFWYRPTAFSSNQNIVDLRGSISDAAPVVWMDGATIMYYTAGSSRITGSTLSANTWYHIALCRYGTSTKLFVDGVQVGSTYTDSNTYIAATSPRLFCDFAGTVSFVNGYIDDLRICRSAKYTADFTPPTQALDYEYTKLLIHADDVNATACVRDENGHAITVNGNAQISTTQSKFGGSSLSLDGTGDYLSLAANTDYGFGTGDFTVEFWIYWNGFPSSNAASIIGTYSSATVGWVLQYRNDGSNRLRLGMTGDTNNLDFAWTPATGQWYHVAVTRSGSSVRAFIDGTQIGTTQTNSSSMDGSTALNIGRLNLSGGIQYVNGYIDEIRISKGLARYTANFTPTATAFALLGQYLYTISGTVRNDSGVLTSRTVRLYRRDTGALVASTTSDASTGAFTFSNPDSMEYYLVALDDSSGTQYNALIYDKVVRG